MATNSEHDIVDKVRKESTIFRKFHSLGNIFVEERHPGCQVAERSAKFCQSVLKAMSVMIVSILRFLSH